MCSEKDVFVDVKKAKVSMVSINIKNVRQFISRSSSNMLEYMSINSSDSNKGILYINPDTCNVLSYLCGYVAHNNAIPFVTYVSAFWEAVDLSRDVKDIPEFFENKYICVVLSTYYSCSNEVIRCCCTAISDVHYYAVGTDIMIRAYQNCINYNSKMNEYLVCPLDDCAFINFNRLCVFRDYWLNF